MKDIRKLYCVLCVFLLLALPVPADAAEKAAPSCVLLLEHDAGAPYTSLLRAGLDRCGRQLGLPVQTRVAAPGEDLTAFFRKAASENDVVLVASDALHEILRDNAANFRRVRFGCIDAGIRAPNIMSVTFADEQAAYLAGVAAAMLTSSGLPGMNAEKTVGWLSGEATPAMASLFAGFSAGVEMAAPDVKIIQAVVGSFDNGALAAQKAEQLLAGGADVIVLAAGAGNAGAMPALKRAGAAMIALDAAPATGPDCPAVAGTIAKAVDRAVCEILASAAGGKFRGREIVVYDLKNGGVAFNGLERYQDAKKLPDLARRVGELRHELEQGSVRLKSLRQRTLCDCFD